MNFETGSKLATMMMFIGLIAISLADRAGAAQLRWQNGDRLAGELLRADATYVVWKSPFFTDPFKIASAHLSRISLTAPDQVSSDPLRFLSRNGDVIYGRLVSIGDEHVVIDSSRGGRITINRSLLRSFRRERFSR